jgi:hypothetical protein
MSRPLRFLEFFIIGAGDAIMDTRRIAVIYDSSFLMGKFQSLKKFIHAKRFSSIEKPGFFKSMFGGKSVGGQKVFHNAGEVLHIYEVVPTEVMEEVKSRTGSADDHPHIKSLRAEGAAKVDLSMDTVAGELPGGSAAGSAAAMDKAVDDKLLLYARRLVAAGTTERYDLAIVATEDNALLAEIEKLVTEGKSLLGVKAEHLTAGRRLHDKVSQIASRDGTTRTLES